MGKVKTARKHTELWLTKKYYRMKKLNRKNLEFIKGLIITILIMTCCFSLLDLYVPLKKILFGDGLTFNEIIEFIKLKEHLPIIIAVSVAIELTRNRKIRQPEQL